MSVPSMVRSHIYYAATHFLDSDQLANVRVGISEIGYCTCRPDLGMLSGLSTCYMKSQTEVQSQQRMYGSKLVILEILHDECVINGG
jgi:hypothetical protein